MTSVDTIQSLFCGIVVGTAAFTIGFYLARRRKP